VEYNFIMKYKKIVANTIIFFILIALFSCKKQPEETVTPHKNISIKTFKLSYYDVPVIKCFTAITKPKVQVKLSAKISGYIKNIFVHEGEKVKKGQLLVIVDEKGIEAKIDALKSAINAVKEQRDALKAKYSYIRSNFIRYRSLLAKKAITKEKFEQIKSQYLALKGQIDALSAKISQISAQLNEAKNELNYVKISSPVNGCVIKKYVDKGSYVGSGDPLITIYDYKKGLWLVAGIDEYLIDKVKRGQDVRVYIPAFNFDRSETISKVIPDIDPLSHTFTIKISILDPKLKAGAFGKVYITIAHKRALLIPKASLIKRGGIDGVYVLDYSRILHWRIVRVCSCPVRGFYEVLSGLKEGDVIAASDLFKLQEGMRVD